MNYFSKQLNTYLGQKFQIVTQPGPGVMKFNVAMVDADAATPVLRSLSMIVPQAHRRGQSQISGNRHIPVRRWRTSRG